MSALTLSPGERRALADMDRHWADRAFVLEAWRDEADAGWLTVRVAAGERPSDEARAFVVSSTGRAWVSPDGRERGAVWREADYDSRRRS